MFILDEGECKFNSFDFQLESFECMSFKSLFKDKESLKNLHIYENKGKIYVEYFKTRCCECNTSNVIKKGFVQRKIKVPGKGEIIIHVRRYYCKKCHKYFQTDLTGLVDENANISHSLKKK